MPAKLAIACVALLHLLFLVLEMFLWTRPPGRRLSGMTEQLARKTATLAANQGLYNGFLAAGLLWGLYELDARRDFVVFLLGCVIVAGVYGGITAGRRIILVQAVPGLLALLLLLLSP